MSIYQCLVSITMDPNFVPSRSPLTFKPMQPRCNLTTLTRPTWRWYHHSCHSWMMDDGWGYWY